MLFFMPELSNWIKNVVVDVTFEGVLLDLWICNYGDFYGLPNLHTWRAVKSQYPYDNWFQMVF